jgi:enoyl-CoA hydratase
MDDGKLNVFNLSVTRELDRIFQELEADEQIKCVVLKGNIKIFSAGLDLHTISNGGADAEILLDAMRDLLCRLYSSRIRIITISTGHAVAAGALLLLVSDYRIGVSGTVKIGFTEVLFGLALSPLPILLIRDRISVDQQFASAVLGKMYDSEEARQAGFLDDLVINFQEAEDRAKLIAKRLAELDDDAYLETLNNMRGATLARAREG